MYGLATLPTDPCVISTQTNQVPIMAGSVIVSFNLILPAVSVKPWTTVLMTYENIPINPD